MYASEFFHWPAALGNRSRTSPLPKLLWAAAALLLGPWLAFAADCDTLPAGKSLWVRLLDPVASYSSKPGTLIRAILIQSPECDQFPALPIGLQLSGHIVSVRRVGMGIRHETASMELVFDTIATTSGTALPISAQLAEIDNARETVSNGVIHGVNATNSPQGRITSRLIHLPTYNPYSDVGLIVYRAFTVLPEPEIYLPPSTDLRLRLLQPLYVGDQPQPPRPSLQIEEDERPDIELLEESASLRTQTSKGQNADLINLAFVGSAAQLQDAFSAAGWLPADPNSSHAFFHEFGAFLTFSNYPTMPVSRQYLDFRAQDFTWQKSFDSYGKREHLRIWQQPQTVLGQQAWLAAYTRETGAALSLKYHKFIHHIDPDLDQGVDLLVRDLTLSGCVASVETFPRPDAPQLLVNSTGDELHTAGALIVVHLQDCEQPSLASARSHPAIAIRPQSRVRRYFRNQILVYKSDVVRGNIVYGTYDLCRMSIHSLRHRHDNTDLR